MVDSRPPVIGKGQPISSQDSPVGEPPDVEFGSVILKLVYPLVNSIRARWIWNRGKGYFVYGKLDPIKVAWIIR
ncbi:MAG: hypothetical protein ACREBS_10360, partial [Nitrososphaerales archaeon]